MTGPLDKPPIGHNLYWEGIRSRWAAARDERMPTSGESGRFRILVVDDEASIRMIVSEVLSEEGYAVETAENGVEALERVKQDDIQLVISDIRMPQMSGIELLAKVKQHDPDIQVIIMTSHASIDTAIQAIRLGAYDYLTKPFEELEVISTVVARTVSKLELELQVKSLLGQLQRRTDEIERLYHHTTQLFKTLDSKKILRAALDALASLADGAATVAYYRVDTSTDSLEPEMWQPDEKLRVEQLPSPTAVKAGANELADGHANRQTVVSALTWNSPPERSSIHPVVVGDQFAGVFAVVRSADSFEDSTRRMMRQYVENVAAQLDKSKLYGRIQSMATRDGLTRLYNRRHFEQFLARELERSRRFDKKLAVILFDIDNFKHYNDANGHPAGDEVLRQVARIVQKKARTVDLVARYGGEEFVIVLIESGPEGAAERAENLRAAIERQAFPAEETQPLGGLTVSGGYATFPECGSTPEELIDAADKALYEAKRAGRNRMRAAEAIREPVGVA